MQSLSPDGSDSVLCKGNELHAYLRQVYFRIITLPHLFKINAPLWIARKCWVRQMGCCIGGVLPNNCDPQTIGADDKVYRTIILHELFVSALKRQNDKHTSVHPPLSTTVPLCGSYGKSNFTHHGLCRLLSISSTQFLWRHCDFINQ